jgi:hypothetical protein
MKIVLICPANMIFMPYVKYYEEILKINNVDCNIISWDRLHIESERIGFTYRDRKKCHKRNYIDYYKFSKYIIKRLEELKPEKVVIFTLQLGHFLKNYLIDKYPRKYIFDIRDYNKFYRFSKFKRMIDISAFTVISSPGYKIWLPKSHKYIVNHNTLFKNICELRPLKRDIDDKKDINIYTIGFIRHWSVNIALIKNLKNLDGFVLSFYGDGMINQKLKNYIKKYNISNVYINGRYNKEDEENIYKKADLVNNFLLNNSTNCKTLLSNRIYNAVIYGKPLLSIKGTYLAEQIERHNLGLVLESLDQIDLKIKKYLRDLNIVEYQAGRLEFMKKVINDNNIFINKVEKFLQANQRN